MTPDAITRLFKEAYDSFPPLEGKPTDDDLLAIREALLPLLMVIPYDQLNDIHSLAAILTEAVKYEAEHGNYKFVRPSRLPLYDKNCYCRYVDKIGSNTILLLSSIPCHWIGMMVRCQVIRLF